MRKMLIATIAAVALSSGAASAADLSMPLKARAANVAPFSWTGCYLGAQAGIGAENDSFTGAFLGGGLAGGGGSGANGYGAVAGGQLGCNYQTGMLVVGVEGDGLWSGIRNTDTISAIGLGSATIESKNEWDADISGRVGAAFDRLLVYGKGGVAWGRFDFSEAISGIGTIDGSATLPGALAGVGMEYAFAPNWSAKIEYNYISFAQRPVNFNGVVVGGPPTASFGANEQLVKFGVNYKLF